MANNSNTQQMLDDIKQALALYNKVATEKMEIVPQVKKEDVSNVYICVYYNDDKFDDKYIGLFEKKDWSRRQSAFSPEFYAGSIYVGVGSSYVGMIKTYHERTSVFDSECIGTKRVLDNGSKCIANCLIDKFMSFDDMRLIMANAELIDDFEVGKATSQEKLEVLKYASYYYGLSHSYSRVKK